MTVTETRPSLLGWMATVAIGGGATGTLALLLVSARNAPAILIFLYTGWVLLPYVALAFGRRRMALRSTAASAVMSVAALLVVAAALTVYVLAAVLPHAPRSAAVFLLVPLACQVLAAGAYAVAVRRARTSSSQTKQE